MKTIIKTSWHKPTDSFAITKTQLDYIHALRNKDNCPEWPFPSTTNAMRSLTKADGSQIIDALKKGETILFE